MLFRIALFLNHKLLQLPYPIYKTLTAADSALRPRRGTLVIADEQNKSSQNVRAVSIHTLVGINYIAAAFAHLLTVLTEQKSLCRAPFVRLAERDGADIEEEFIPKPRINKVACDVLHTSVVPIHRPPIGKLLLVR